MAMKPFREWFGRSGPDPAIPRPEPPAPARPEAPPEPPRTPWPAARLAVTDALWGEGYLSPGGEVEVLRLAKPLGLSAASSLLLLGAGAGGPPCSISAKLGGWVSGFEADPELLTAATGLAARGPGAKRVQLAGWDPRDPAFRAHFYHHGVAFEPLAGAPPEPVLAAVADALKAGGQFMLTELCATPGLDPAHGTVIQWAGIERRDPRALPAEAAITRTLGRLGFDVRVAEDISERHMRAALAGWRAAVRRMEDDRPTPAEMMRYVREAELWLLRLRLFQSGWLRLIRWHAIGR